MLPSPPGVARKELLPSPRPATRPPPAHRPPSSSRPAIPPRPAPVSKNGSFTSTPPSSGRALLASALSSEDDNLDDDLAELERFFSSSSSSFNNNNNPFDALMIDDDTKQQPVPPPPPPPPPPPRTRPQYRVLLWDFDGAAHEGALTVRAGDRVLVHSCLNTTTTDNNNTWASCTGPTGGERGLVPAKYLATLQELAQLAPCPSSSPRRRMGGGVVSGYARDLIAVRSIDRAFGPVTVPAVRFYGASSKLEHVHDRVLVYVDDCLVHELRMGQGGVPVLPSSSTAKAGKAWDLAQLAPHALRDVTVQQLAVRFEHVSVRGLSYVECALHVWNALDDCIVSDIDGTITKSDLAGHFNTTLRQKAGLKPNNYAHEGVCGLFTHLQHALQSRFLYLTARPLNLCAETKQFLCALEQDAGTKRLPVGPCITDDSNMYQSISREVGGTADRFKSEYLLNQLLPCFERARQGVTDHSPPVFLIGFGNKVTDAVAYARAGVHAALIFVIDSNSQIAVDAAGEFAKPLTSYHDPILEAWLVGRCVQQREQQQQH